MKEGVSKLASQPQADRFHQDLVEPYSPKTLQELYKGNRVDSQTLLAKNDNGSKLLASKHGSGAFKNYGGIISKARNSNKRESSRERQLTQIVTSTANSKVQLSSAEPVGLNSMINGLSVTNKSSQNPLRQGNVTTNARGLIAKTALQEMSDYGENTAFPQV